MDPIGIVVKKCPHCGKRFVLPGGEKMWAYKTKTRVKYFCSWGCLRAAEKHKERERLERKRRNISEGAKRGWERRRANAGTA